MLLSGKRFLCRVWCCLFWMKDELLYVVMVMVMLMEWGVMCVWLCMIKWDGYL